MVVKLTLALVTSQASFLPFLRQIHLASFLKLLHCVMHIIPLCFARSWQGLCLSFGFLCGHCWQSLFRLGATCRCSLCRLLISHLLAVSLSRLSLSRLSSQLSLCRLLFSCLFFWELASPVLSLLQAASCLTRSLKPFLVCAKGLQNFW